MIWCHILWFLSFQLFLSSGLTIDKAHFVKHPDSRLRKPNFCSACLVVTWVSFLTIFAKTLQRVTTVLLVDSAIKGRTFIIMCFFFSQDIESPRYEILHTIDPFAKYQGENMYPDIYNTQVKSALRQGQWKLMTGNVGEYILTLMLS